MTENLQARLNDGLQSHDGKGLGAEKSRGLIRRERQSGDNKNEKERRQRLQPALRKTTMLKDSRLVYRHAHEQQPGEPGGRSKLSNKKVVPVSHAAFHNDSRADRLRC